MSDLNIRNNLHQGIEFNVEGSNLVASVTVEGIGAAPAFHEHPISEVEGLSEALDNKLDADSNFDGRYLRVDANQSLGNPFQAFGRQNLGLGSAAVLNAPVSGDAGPTEVVLGGDSRLTGGGGGGSGTHEINIGSMTGSVAVDLDSNKVVNAYGTLTGNVTLSFDNIASGGVSVVTLAVTQDGTGGRTLAFPAGTVVLNGADGSINPQAGATSWLTFVRVGGTWHVSVSDARPTDFDDFYWSIPDNGSYIIGFNKPRTLDFANAEIQGGATVAFHRSSDGGSSWGSPLSSTQAFSNGDLLRLTVSGFDSFCTVTVSRIA